MKHIFKGVCALISAIVCLSGCDEDRVMYNGPDYIMFSDTLSTVAVQNSDDYHNIYVSATQACDYDRTFGIEVVSKESNAIEGLHYKLESGSVTIKAGERATALRIRGLYDNFEYTDSIGVTLRLTSLDKIWNIYGNKTKVVLRKVCPFNVDVFTGYCRIRSSYFESYFPGKEYRLIRTERDPEDTHSIIMKNFMYNGYDLKVKFSVKNPLEPFVNMDEQKIATTGDAFQTIWGDDVLRMQLPSNYVSYFNVCESFMIQYMMLYVKDVGTVGTYVNVIEWISEAEAKMMLKESSTSNGLPKDDKLNQR